MNNTILQNLEDLIKDSLINNFSTKLIWKKFYTIESMYEQWDIVVREFDSEEEYIKLEWEVKDEDLDILYINAKKIFSEVLDDKGFILLDLLENKSNIKNEIKEIGYFIIDFFWIKE